MSVYIKGMEMPRNCDDCHFDIDCAYDESQDGYKMMGGRPRKCPLVPVPPHGRLIDAEKIYDAVERRYRMSSGIEHKCERDLLDLICAAPAIIEAEEGDNG